MPQYTFHSLSDADFEDLACDLLQKSLGLDFQAFTKGRDSGIDLLNATNGKTIVQCKHYCRSTYATLKSNIINKERPKLENTKPDRFILVTSLGLTPNNKDELLSHLAPFCKGTHDIYGCDDINKLLRKYSDIEKAHYKLWLTSTQVLQLVLRHGSAVWNAMAKDDIKRKMSLYVQTDAYVSALDILAEHNYCILSGIPGIGKTTLAQVLVTKLIDDGYELIAVRSDIQEALDGLDLTKKQVVYYDDFLGQSDISERLGKNEDRDIVRLLKEAQRAKQLKVILTTREYILEDAKRIYEPLNGGELEEGKCIVKVEDYTRGLRARILYNHVYFSGLPHTYAMAVIKDKSYRQIIDHKGYSPRIVEWMTMKEGGLAGIEPDGYMEEFLRVLDDPAKLWQHAFDNQINADARYILYCLGTTDGWFGLDELLSVWRGIVSSAPTLEDKNRFMAAIRQLDGSFIRTTRVRSAIAVDFHNPSIKDYLRKRIVSDNEVLITLLRNALFFEQVSCLVRLDTNGHATANATGILQDNTDLHDAIERTLDAKASTYRLAYYGIYKERHLMRVKANIGGRFSIIARWAKTYKSDGLLQLVYNIALYMVKSGNCHKIATVESSGFLSAVLDQYSDDEKCKAVVRRFIDEITKYMCDLASLDDWETWTTFLKEHENTFIEEEMNDWAQRVDAFCEKEVDAIIDNAETSSEAQDWYRLVESLLERWGYSTTPSERYYELLDGLEEEEEDMLSESYEDWSRATVKDRTPDDNKEIDWLFESLNNIEDCT